MDNARPRDAGPPATAAASASASAQTWRRASDAPTPNPNPNPNPNLHTNPDLHTSRVQQPKPQALPARGGPSSILVSPRQKGNPILNSVRTVAWEYSDIPADYVLGATTCALFLSLKYHRLHPEYIYNRIRDLKGQYQLRILLVMVDIENHEESLRELSKTSLINNVTIMLAWSAQEAGRYLELFKTFEHTAPTSIKAQQSSTYSDSMVEFITAPRSINKTDAVGLVSNFGSIRTAVNAGPEEIGLIAGWGTKKVQRWCNSVREPFRIKKAAKRTLTRDNTQASLPRDASVAEDVGGSSSNFDLSTHHKTSAVAEPFSQHPERSEDDVIQGANVEDTTGHATAQPAGAEREIPNASPEKRKAGNEMSEGIMAALNKLREQ